MRAILDSDILIDYLQGLASAKKELSLYARREISIISWMELLVGAQTAEEERACRELLSTFIVHEISSAVAETAVQLRKLHRLRLPDAVIWATAQSEGILLVTRNTKDFKAGNPGVRIPYKVP